MDVTFSNKVKEIIYIGRGEAIKLKNDKIYPEHLLLGILNSTECIAHSIIQSLDTSISGLKLAVTLNLGNANLPHKVKDVSTEIIQFSNEMETLWKFILHSAHLCKINEIATSYVLFAMLRKGTELSQLLNMHGISYSSISSAVFNKSTWPTESFGGNDILFSVDFKNNCEKFLQTVLMLEESEKDLKSNNKIVDIYTKDLTKEAKLGKIEPVIWRDNEISRLTQILGRRKKNNSILIGEPGVGKTAIVEGLALQIATNNVPNNLLNSTILTLDITSLISGTKYRGQFEERIKNLLVELESSPKSILFIDEIHTIVGAGNAPGSLDVSNILKPALARGNLRCIGATTTAEYKKYIEKESALTRRFQPIMIYAATVNQTIDILNNIKGKYEEYHNVIYTPEAIKACVYLADRYIKRLLPDKAIDVMDDAGASVGLFVKTVDKSTRYTITEEAIINTVSQITGIPNQKISNKNFKGLLSLADNLKKNIVGQDHAIDKVVKSILRSHIGVADPKRPIGVFLFLGPTGVGKTALAKALALELFACESAMIRLDMSEYSERISISRLIGAPPGYVGYEQGGQLTEKLRDNPYCILLLDEIEKAHHDVHNLFLQVMEDSVITDGFGVKVECNNVIIVMTSNVGASEMESENIGFSVKKNETYDISEIEQKVQRSIRNVFKPEFIRRLDDIVIFKILNKNNLLDISSIFIAQLQKRIESLSYNLKVTESAKMFLCEKASNIQYGTKFLKKIIQTELEDAITLKIASAELGLNETIVFDHTEGKNLLDITIQNHQVKKKVRVIKKSLIEVL